MAGHELAEPEPSAPARRLTSPSSQTDLPFAAPSPVDASHVAPALSIIARARFMTDGAREAGPTREALSGSLSEDAAPRLTTRLGVMRALGVRLTAEVGTVGRRGANFRADDGRPHSSGIDDSLRFGRRKNRFKKFYDKSRRHVRAIRVQVVSFVSISKIDHAFRRKIMHVGIANLVAREI